MEKEFECTFRKNGFTVNVNKTEDKVSISGLELDKIETFDDLLTIDEILKNAIDALYHMTDVVYKEEECVGPCWVN